MVDPLSYFSFQLKIDCSQLFTDTSMSDQRKVLNTYFLIPKCLVLSCLLSMVKQN